VRYRLIGNIDPIGAPRDINGEINVIGLWMLVTRAIWQGANAIFGAGTTGCGFRMSVKELSLLTHELATAIRGRVPLLIGCWGHTVDEVIEKTNAAKNHGADFAVITGLLSMGPNPHKELLYRILREIIRRSPLPVVLYNIPSQTGYTIPREIIVRLDRDFPGKIAGYKDSTGDLATFCLLLKAGLSFPCFWGKELDLVAALRAGAAGSISSFHNVCLPLFVKLLDAVGGEDSKAAEQCQVQLERAYFNLVGELKGKDFDYFLEVLGAALSCGTDCPVILNDPGHEYDRFATGAGVQLWADTRV
jgi:4-hydroxy-tetrahydrodipicolinate synthase